MKTFLVISWITVAAASWAAAPANSQPGPKNLVSPAYRASSAQVAAPHRLTEKQVRKLAMTAETVADHRKLAEFYTSQADRLDTRASAYEKAAAFYRSRPSAKNLSAPTTVARYESAAKTFRDEAKANRAVAVSHERMAQNVSASVK